MYISTFFFSSRRRHTRLQGDWSSDVCSSDLRQQEQKPAGQVPHREGGAGVHRAQPHTPLTLVMTSPLTSANATSAQMPSAKKANSGTSARSSFPSRRRPTKKRPITSGSASAASDSLKSNRFDAHGS